MRRDPTGPASTVPGPTGPQGATGPQGSTGTSGPQGVKGDPGADGEKWFSQAGIPAPTDGIIGDWSLNTDTGDYYEKVKTGPSSSAWTYRGNLQGPEGQQGYQGPQGPQGATGPTGAAGLGVPAGGTANQVLAKIDSTDNNTRWVDQTGGGGGGTGNLNWRGLWVSGATYAVNDAVYYSNVSGSQASASWVCIAAVSGGVSAPFLDPTHWFELGARHNATGNLTQAQSASPPSNAAELTP